MNLETVPQVQSSASSKGERTKARILDAAYDSIIQKGFAGTSIDELVEATGITKSGFFYHFRDKSDLARQLLVRFLAEDDAVIDSLKARAEQLVDDPLQQFLLFLNLYAELVDEMDALHPGCLVAAVVYQEQVFDAEVRRLNSEAVMRWRERFLAWLEAIDRKHQPVTPLHRLALADALSAIVEGAIVLAKALDDRALMGRQLRLFRDMVKTTYGVA
ncbi:TetR/AcrR family transcriptional regulator [Croceibacterium sp. LX-88]|uniref:TetR/AcrR family transcriptional regulator n=1 Tax=Croceibacterium selenioxidans TaxID=2838833 RepID=A0ABS5W191_9SPHN|nr:TetR/AcrR family transcriptional regulator [Croceibacterium selenioxidans]MBT2133540.1 TetR/AcrR family transcriptional regulator [Croceibacterium selenioxidans]